VDWELESTAVFVGRAPLGSTPGAAHFALATAPGESFTALQIGLHSRLAGVTGETRTFLFGYTNGYHGYLPNSEAANCAEQVGDRCALGFAGYGVLTCIGPTFMGRGSDGVETAGEQIIDTAVSSLTSLNQH